MDKSFLDIAGFAPLLNRFLRQKVPRGLGKSAKREGGAVNVSQSRFALGSRSWDVFAYEPLANRLRPLDLSLGRLSTRKPISGFTVFKGSGRQYCMQSIPLAVLKPAGDMLTTPFKTDCMQSIPLAVLKHFSTLWSAIIPNHCMQSIPLAVLKLKTLNFLRFRNDIACNLYRLRY